MPDVRMPRLSDTMTEGILSQWLKHEGEQVSRGDVLAEIETDKATMELEADDSGVLTRILVEPGTTVPIGQPIAVIGEPDATAPQAAAAPAAAAPAAAAPQPTRPPAAAPAAPRSVEVRTSPLARAIAREHGLDIATITGTGPGGRIVRADVQDAVAARDRATTPPAGSAAPGSGDTEVRLNSIRRITAQRLTESAAAPHFYLTSVVDAQPLLALRSELNTQLAGATGAPRISVTDLLVCACAIALRAHPGVNSSWAGDHLVQRGQVNIGLAVALPDGLIVPVIRDADRKGVRAIASEAHALSDRARAGKLTLEEFSGGTFTISNLGMYGVDHFTAVINPPEAAILAVGAARDEPVVRDGELVAGTTMKLTLTIDHRVLDGAAAAAFLRDLVGLLEQPLRILA
ncbi:2-oxo acid dehydrogenase subunit E2 [Jatrophihabitans cynanchi]|uniref:Dihydrolipoamide acetyltransferase component of pyruvate dehydrogenase complex n=1 Tax=Jatrophihabitans cynanchi TaxID=2944128 RepID=A0ABY7JWZ7_9ACTN|nr:dihydrolipoamide acetyltransferase family protein [Jatrophihabitans sp. SB3-54]WAX55832.1 2-oxo acid dehydrogenase subunit E2 [Jatrophihabitans sp. SB3-54]